MQHKLPRGPQLPTSSNWEAEDESPPTSHHLHLMWHEINLNSSTLSFVKALHIPNEAVHSAQSSIAGLSHAKQLIKLASAGQHNQSLEYPPVTPLSAMETDRSYKPGAGKSSLKKGSGMAYLRVRCQLFYVQHQTPYPLPRTYVAGRFSVVPNVLCVEIPDQQWHIS